uniref:Cytidyltransferase-like domain-containing protein n=1 Tax=viral metagenome TaxID=1070528 RepID=A0A6C0AQR0_9ZZZZ
MSIEYNNNNTIIFSIARMNPPTPGHMFLVETLIREAIDKNVNDVYVILSKTNDNQDDPIPCPEKINVLSNDTLKSMVQSLKQKMILDAGENIELIRKIDIINVHTICVPEVPRATPFTPLIPIIGAKEDIPNVNLILIIGDDRKNMADSITDFFFKWPNIFSVDVQILPREEMSEFKALSKDPAKLDTLVIDRVPVNAMSASFVRNIVRNERRDKFEKLYESWLAKELIYSLYESLQEGIHGLPPDTKKDPPEKPLKYRYPMIKGISEFPVKKKGGKTRRKRSRKSKIYRKRTTYKKKIYKRKN